MAASLGTSLAQLRLEVLPVQREHASSLKNPADATVPEMSPTKRPRILSSTSGETMALEFEGVATATATAPDSLMHSVMMRLGQLKGLYELSLVSEEVYKAKQAEILHDL